MVRVDTTAFESGIKHTYDKYEAKAFDLFQWYAVEIVKYMMIVQGGVPEGIKGAFWTNHTYRAVKAFLSSAWQVPTKVMGVTMEYRRTPWYTEVLEHGHGGKFAAVPRLIERFEPLIIADLQKLYGRD